MVKISSIRFRKLKMPEIEKIKPLWQGLMDDNFDKVAKRNPNLKEERKMIKNPWRDVKKYYSDNIKKGKGVIFVAEHNDEIIAHNFNLIKLNIPIFLPKELGYIGELYVEKGYRSLGIGNRFRKMAFDWFKKKGIKRASIQVMRDNPMAHKLYKRWGFHDFKIEMRKNL
ncbi:GNAT family N-acetyltransferase [Candidatus Woesearchaeota archaeon]|nr:GNAT family N-acetyltransferase [Candidatus Woesearchaeota archaeon]